MAKSCKGKESLKIKNKRKDLLEDPISEEIVENLRSLGLRVIELKHKDSWRNLSYVDERITVIYWGNDYKIPEGYTILSE